MAVIKKIVLIISCLIFMAIGAFFVPVTNALVISQRGNPKSKICSLLACDTGFVISYTHSVNKGRVHDYYSCGKKKPFLINLEKTVFVSYGAGIPEPEDVPEAVFSVTKDGYELKGYSKSYPQLVMAVGLIANHSIMLANQQSREFFLTDFFEPQTGIILNIKRISLAEYLLLRKQSLILEYLK